LLGHQVVSYKQKKRKGFQKHNISIITQILRVALRPNPEG
jgi:hypothetical protein